MIFTVDLSFAEVVVGEFVEQRVVSSYALFLFVRASSGETRFTIGLDDLDRVFLQVRPVFFPAREADAPEIFTMLS